MYTKTPTYAGLFSSVSPLWHDTGKDFHKQNSIHGAALEQEMVFGINE
jgi:hypothetical protein